VKKTVWPFLLLMLSSAFKGLRANSTDLELTKLKFFLTYVRLVKTLRLLFMSLLSMGVCLVFLLTAIILLHVSLFLYAPWDRETKMVVGLTCSIFYLLATLVVFYQAFASDKWLRIFHADGIMNHLHKEVGQKDMTNPDE